MRCRALIHGLLGLCSCTLAAQEATSSPAPYTLHVYTNLVQVPTLIVDEKLNPVPNLALNRFDIRIDSGPVFHPTNLRREGNDPISLAILLDMSGDIDYVAKAVAEALPSLAQTSLQPQDHVTFYALDCKLIRSTNDEPVTPQSLQQGISAALAAEHLHNGKIHGTCGRHLPLRNALAQIMHALRTSPGRRVLLAVTNGRDGSSSVPWSALENYAATNSISVFGIRDPFPNTVWDESFIRGRSRGSPYPVDDDKDETLFRALCDNSGGILQPSTRFQASQNLQLMIAALRERYIVEFPRPDDSQPGIHDIQVRIAGKNLYLIRAAGVSISLPDPGQANDPNTVPVSKSPAVFGTHKPVKPSN